MAKGSSYFRRGGKLCQEKCTLLKKARNAKSKRSATALRKKARAVQSKIHRMGAGCACRR